MNYSNEIKTVVAKALDEQNLQLSELLSVHVECVARLLVIAAANSDATIHTLTELISHELDQAIVMAVEEWNDHLDKTG